jgi:RNA polymerase sigma factor (sigma-70 family)
MTELPSGLEALPDEDLARLCARRPVDQEAWEVFYERFYDYTRNLIGRKLSGSKADADDLVQEAILKIFRGLPAYDPVKSRIKTYISRIVDNLVIDYFRHGAERRAKTVSVETEISLLQLRATQSPEILRVAAERIIDELGDRSRIQLMRDLLSGRDVQEICAERGLTEYQVYASRKWLRNLLRDINTRFSGF